MSPAAKESESPADGARWDWYVRPRVWIPAAVILVALVAAFGSLWAVAASDNGGEEASGFIPAGDTLRQPVHWHADFALVIRGQQFSFNSPEFMSKEGEEKDPYVHIHEPRPTVVHAHREQTTWDEFFRSLGFQLTDTSLTLQSGEKLVNNGTETLKFYVNGTRIDTLMFQEIADLQKTLITFGPETDADVLANQWPLVTDQACIPSEVCKERIPEVPEPEPCSKSAGSCAG